MGLHSVTANKKTVKIRFFFLSHSFVWLILDYERMLWRCQKRKRKNEEKKLVRKNAISLDGGATNQSVYFQ